MVALHPVPLDNGLVDRSIPDDDLVVALPADATIDRAGADAVVEFATHDRADAWYGDIVVADHLRLRPAWSPTRLIADPTAATPLAVRAGWLRAASVAPGAPDLPFRLVRDGADVVHVTAPLTRHRSEPARPHPDVVAAHVAEIGLPATVGPDGRLGVAAGFAPEVGIVIPTAGATLADGSVAVARLLDHLDPLPDRIEIVLVVGDEFRGDSHDLEGPGRTVVRRPPGPFDFSAAVNLGVLQARSPLVLLLNDDTEPADAGFVDRMAVHLADRSVSAVGALLTYPDGTVQHAGVVIDDARPLHSFVGWTPEQVAARGALIARDVAAVTGACLMVRRHDFLAVGGLSETFPLSFNDIDLCVRLRRTGGRIVVEPAASLVHHETLTREPVIAPEEWDTWIGRWGEMLDPWYHPGHHRPDDPHDLARNADHLPPAVDRPPTPPVARRPVLRSRVHRGRVARAGG